jgi:hypothetical protein
MRNYSLKYGTVLPHATQPSSQFFSASAPRLEYCLSAPEAPRPTLLYKTGASQSPDQLDTARCFDMQRSDINLSRMVKT